jgi:hypothetical protein
MVWSVQSTNEQEPLMLISDGASTELVTTRSADSKDNMFDNDQIGGAVSGVVDIAAFAKDPNVQSGGAALASTGALVMMIPAAPFTQAIGGAMMLAGGMM